MDYIYELTDLIEKYYCSRTGKPASPDRRRLCEKMLGCGLSAKSVMDAIDAALCQYGMNGAEASYWDVIHTECRNTYRRMRKEGLL